ncbi:hypothetical protein EV639_10876 [Rathayibacter tanaceti]|uniref:Uncharacterized protein n=2 Tax=Rathayibacter tanaceti TaxID=1671680 RepID=A0ACD2XHP6_9MICO|nr:hypothetical protein ACH61_01295 [Rathayibacter tanaceti]TCO36211.1 hypothetical protein EV639_10876 [Rathayibacter tanaceti]
MLVTGLLTQAQTRERWQLRVQPLEMIQNVGIHLTANAHRSRRPLHSDGSAAFWSASTHRSPSTIIGGDRRPQNSA